MIVWRLLPDIGGVIVLRPGKKVCLHDLLGVVRRNLPDRGVSLVAALGKLKVKVSAAAVHLQDLDGGGVRVVHLYHRVVARVEGQLDPHQGFDPVGVGCPCSSDIVAEAPGAGVDIQGVLHDAGLPTQEHHIEGRVAPRRYYLQTTKVTMIAVM